MHWSQGVSHVSVGVLKMPSSNFVFWVMKKWHFRLQPADAHPFGLSTIPLVPSHFDWGHFHGRTLKFLICYATQFMSDTRYGPGYHLVLVLNGRADVSAVSDATHRRFRLQCVVFTKIARIAAAGLKMFYLWIYKKSENYLSISVWFIVVFVANRKYWNWICIE